MSNPPVLTPEQCRAARGLINWSQNDLEKKSKIAKKTIADFELGNTTPYSRTTEALRRALEGAGVIFIDSNGDGPGVRLRKRKS